MSINNIKEYIMEKMSNFGYLAEKCASKDEIRRFIDNFRPRKTELPLIRIGSDADGGYLIPNALGGIVACFSPGVASTCAFELALADQGIKCFLADASVENPPESHRLFDFTKKYIGVVDNENYITLDAWVQTKAPSSGDLILQMDIEGDEWVSMLNISNSTLLRFRIIIIEFHNLHRLGVCGIKTMSALMSRLRCHFDIVHLHPNNIARPISIAGIPIPPMLEVTLARRDHIETTGWAEEFPHPLDRRNIPSMPEVVLPNSWYSGFSESNSR